MIKNNSTIKKVCDVSKFRFKLDDKKNINI
jgi:hypothetical protein